MYLRTSYNISILLSSVLNMLQYINFAKLCIIEQVTLITISKVKKCLVVVTVLLQSKNWPHFKTYQYYI